MEKLCVTCNEAPRVGYRYCEACNIKATEAYTRKRIASLKANKQKKTMGINPKWLNRHYKED